MFPIVVPTSLALLALANDQDDKTQAGLNWLLTQREQTTSLFSLGWAVTALKVLGQIDDNWRNSVVSLWDSLPAERRGPMDTALCMLGLGSGDTHPMEVA